MTRAILAALAFCAITAAQTQANITAGTSSWKVTLPPKITSNTLSCDHQTAPGESTLQAGETMTCTVTIPVPAPGGGYLVSPYSADPPLLVNPTGVLVVPAGATSVQFSVTRPATAQNKKHQKKTVASR